MKNVLRIYRQPEGHWVGDGFPVHTVLDYQRHPELSPFLLLDHAGPADFPPAAKPRGVGWHPHRGFETVTVVLDGEVDHEDTAGNGGRIGTGDVQWMTAGSGLLHKEMHSDAFTRPRRPLPRPAALGEPAGEVEDDAAALPDAHRARNSGGRRGARSSRANSAGVKGPAQTFTPVNLLEVRVRAGQQLRLDLHDGFSAGLYIVEGKTTVNGEAANAGELVVLDREGDGIVIDAATDAVVFVMNGAPIDEPVVGSGPFVMNTHAGDPAGVRRLPRRPPGNDSCYGDHMNNEVLTYVQTEEIDL